MKRTIMNPKGIDPICECGANNWLDTSATIAYKIIYCCNECKKNRVAE